MRTLYCHALLTSNNYGKKLKIVLTSMLNFIVVCHQYLHKCTCSNLIFYAKLALKFYFTYEAYFRTIFLIFVVPSIMLYSSEISPTRCNNCVFILRNGFTLHVSDDSLTHHQEYICCIWPQVSRLT